MKRTSNRTLRTTLRKTMELHKVPRGSIVRIVDDKQVHVPPAALPAEEGQVFQFSGIDGMYGKCTRVSDGELTFVAAWTMVEIVKK